MQFKISIEPGGKIFAAEDGQTILESGLDAGLLFPYGCRDGACGSCKGEILSGEVVLESYSASALTPAEQAAGMTLFCRAKPRSDLRIKPRSVGTKSDNPVKKLPCRVQELNLVAPDVMIIKIKLPATDPFRFRAGQYIDFLLSDGRRRSFSIANMPENTDHLELHVRRVDQGHFTTHVFEKMKVRDILRFEGPLGSFQLNAESTKPAILLAGGTGFAPIKSLLESAIAAKNTRTFKLYWGSRDQQGLYMDQLAKTWADQHPNIDYIPVLSDAASDDNWTGRRGLAHTAVIEDFPDLSGHEVYACGSPAMIDAARSGFTLLCGLPQDAFFADAFTFASDPTT